MARSRAQSSVDMPKEPHVVSLKGMQSTVGLLVSELIDMQCCGMDT